MATPLLRRLILLSEEKLILREQFSKMQNLVNVLPNMLSRAKYDRVIEILDELKIKMEKEKGALDVW
jgi:hypothetical protein